MGPAVRAAHCIRTNTQWLADLRQPTQTEQTAEELRTYLRKALARVLRGRGNVDESDLDDFTQDALIRILQGLDRFRGDSRFTTWATAVAIRTAFGTLRRRRYQQQHLEDLELGLAEPVAGLYSLGGDPGQLLDRATLVEALRRAINDALTENQRTVILGELAGIPTDVLVERLGTNPNALYKLHHDARKKLKRALNNAGYSDEDVRLELLETSERS